MEKYSRMKVSAKQLFNFLSRLWSVFPWEFEVKRTPKFKQSNTNLLPPPSPPPTHPNNQEMPCQPHLNMLFSLLLKTINFHPSVIFSQMSERDRPTSNTKFRNLLQIWKSSQRYSAHSSKCWEREKQPNFAKVFSPKTIWESSVSCFGWITWIWKVYYLQK